MDILELLVARIERADAEIDGVLAQRPGQRIVNSAWDRGVAKMNTLRQTINDMDAMIYDNEGGEW